MTRGGRRRTTWDTPWENRKTKIVRVPEALAEEILAYAHVIDRKETLPVTAKEETPLKERADKFLMTIPPNNRRATKRLLYKFIDSIKDNQPT